MYTYLHNRLHWIKYINKSRKTAIFEAQLPIRFDSLPLNDRNLLLQMRVFAVVALLAVCAAEEEYGARLGGLKPSQLLKSYQGFVNDVVRTDDAYRSVNMCL